MRIENFAKYETECYELQLFQSLSGNGVVWHCISVCNQPSRSTQPSTLRVTVKWVLTKRRLRWCSAAGE